ncbi:MAG: GIY-YIG nuclease family protein [bacterium]|nr:GIY-YIG nuclease family protein [bacterium]
MENKISYVYILASKKNGTLYTGVTSNLLRRVYEHKKNVVKSFTEKYNVHLLVHYEIGESMVGAIEREKQIKAGSRKKKILLIESKNPEWKDLYSELL